METVHVAAATQFSVTTPAFDDRELAAQSSSPARVLHVINGEHFSGAERVQQLLGKRLGNYGYEALFACVKPGQFRESSQLRKHQVFDTPMRGRFDLSVVSRLVHLAQEKNVVLLHAHTPRTALVASLAARRLSIPWAYHVHSPTIRDSTRPVLNRFNAWIERLTLRSCDLVITVSRSLRREMLRLGVERSRLAVVPNGVPAMEPINADARSSRKRWRIGMLALMRPRKGVESAVHAMQHIRDHRLPVTLDLVGNFETPGYQEDILRLIEELQLQDHVAWRGFTSDVTAVIRELDGLVLPSLFGEGMPMVVLEAISAGVPVVATRVEGTPEVIRDGIEGYLAEPGSSQSLAEKLELLTSDRDAWKRLSRQAVMRHRQAFSDGRMAENISRAYARIGVAATSRG